METLIGFVLLGGVLLSAVLLGAGWIWTLAASGHPDAGSRLPKVGVARFAAETIRQILSSGPEPRTTVDLGIVVLLFTPYLRVLLSVGYFFFRRNVKYGVLTLVVLVLLTVHLVG